MELKIIQQRIYTIRNQRVMLDFDLAEIYGVLTKRLNEQVRRNINRFPSEFMFQLTEYEWEMMRSQFATASQSKRNNIAIVKASIALRQYSLMHNDLGGILNELRYRLGEHDIQLAAIYDTIETLLDKKVTEEERLRAWNDRPQIGFNR